MIKRFVVVMVCWATVLTVGVVAGQGRADAARCPDVEVMFARGTVETAPPVGLTGLAFSDALRRDLPGKSLIGEVIDPETLWSCRTCGACLEICPVGVEHPIKIGQGEWTAVVGVMEGTFTQAMPLPDGSSIPPTGKAFKLTMTTVGHWNADGTMSEEYLFWDNATFMRQLGLAP